MDRGAGAGAALVTDAGSARVANDGSATFAIGGEVVDEAGRPIAGATVFVSDGTFVRPSGFDSMGELGVLRGVLPFPDQIVQGGAMPSASAVSDQSGRFAVRDLRSRSVVIAVAHDRFLSRPPVVVELDKLNSLRIVLAQGVSLRGRVLDSRGQPLATVTLSTAEGRMLAVSDRHGEFSIAGVGPNDTLVARLGGYYPQRRTLAALTDTTLDIQLERAEERMIIEVLDDRDRPVVGAKAEVRPVDGETHVFVTDRSGRVESVAFAPPPVKVSIGHSDFAPAVVEIAHYDEPVQVVLQPGGGLAGVIVDVRAGTVPRGIELEVRNGNEVRKLPVVAGRFIATSLAAGGAELVARAPGYVVWRRTVTVPPSDRLRAVTVEDVRVELERSGMVHGVVRDERGDLAAGVAVSCGDVRTTTDARGEFILTGLPGGAARVTASKQEVRVSGEVEVRADDDRLLDLHF